MNFRQIRREREMTLEDVAKGLAERGHTISDSALSKLERGIRRADADDLTALAAVLNVGPLELLTPSNDSDENPLLTGAPKDLTHEDIDAWLTGQADLTHESLAQFYYREAKQLRSLAHVDALSYSLAKDEISRKASVKKLGAWSGKIGRLEQKALEHFQFAGILELDQTLNDLPSRYTVVDLTRFISAPDGAANKEGLALEVALTEIEEEAAAIRPPYRPFERRRDA